MSSSLCSLTIACLVAGCLSACTKTSDKTCEKSEVADGASLLQSSAFLESSASSMSIALKKKVGAGLGGGFQRGRESGNNQHMHKLEYFGEISAGGQKFIVVYDTGSANLLIPGANCESTACKNHHRFDKTKSSTAKDVNCNGKPLKGGRSTDELTITFGTGRISGKCMQDQICIGDLCAPGVFMASTLESASPFGTFKFDGILGLSRTVMAQGPEFSMMHRMVENKLLKQPIFSVFLSDSDDEVSEVTFGEAKKEHMASELIWVPVNPKSGYWEVTMDDITFNNKKQGICKECRVAVDTGTSELAGPSEVIGLLRTKIQVEPDCSNFDQLPKLGFAIGKHVLNLAPEEYVDNTPYGESSRLCGMKLMSLDVPPPKGPLFIFGIPFLQKYFTVYDHTEDKVGFAVAKHVGREPEVLAEVVSPDDEDDVDEAFGLQQIKSTRHHSQKAA